MKLNGIQVSDDPAEYKVYLLNKTNKRIEDERKESESKIAEWDKNRPGPPSSFLCSLFSLGGIVAGFFACANSVDMGFFVSFGIWAVVTLIGVTIGAALLDTEQNACAQSQKSVNNQIDQEKIDLEKRIERIRKESNDEQIAYNLEFENAVKKMSTQFVESELAKEVIDWMTEGFCKVIDAADRRKHVENIIVPFVFSVYKDRIICDLGYYDFEINRCRNLVSPLEEMALARAIATTIQLNIIMNYPKDASGTDISIEITYNNQNTTMTYWAPNGNYEELKDW